MTPYEFEFSRQEQSSYLMIYFHLGIDLKPSKLKLVLVFSELLMRLNTKFYCKQAVLFTKLYVNNWLIFGLTRRQFIAALSTIDFSTIDIEGISINEFNLSGWFILFGSELWNFKICLRIRLSMITYRLFRLWLIYSKGRVDLKKFDITHTDQIDIGILHFLLHAATKAKLNSSLFIIYSLNSNNWIEYDLNL